MPCLSPIKVRNPALRGRFSKARLDSLVESDRALFLREMSVLPSIISVPCGKCFECRKKRSSEWRSRLLLETIYGNHSNAIFVTLTLDADHLQDIETSSDPDRALKDKWRLFRDRYRKKFGKPFWWFITELGESSGRLHLHGVIWDVPFYVPSNVQMSYHKMADVLSAVWKYGFVWCGYFTAASAAYITKYMLKLDSKNGSESVNLRISSYKSRVFCSAGIGRVWIDKYVDYVRNKYFSYGIEPNFLHINGFAYCLPRYYLYRSTTLEERRARNFEHSLFSVFDDSIYKQFSYRFGKKVYSSYADYFVAVRNYSSELHRLGYDSVIRLPRFDLWDIEANRISTFFYYLTKSPYGIIKGYYHG